jgi:hypothetical protein
MAKPSIILYAPNKSAKNYLHLCNTFNTLIIMKYILTLAIALLFSCSKEKSTTINNPCITNCNLIPAAGNCKAAITKYYYNQQTNQCDSFNWGGCNGAVPFNTYQECLNCGCD